MEYGYRNGSKEKDITIQLQKYEMVVISDGAKRAIPYSEITDIRLSKKRKVYQLQISSLDHGSVLISSHSFKQDGAPIYQARAYFAFIRVLHMHLYEKSKATYSTGCDLVRLLFQLGIWSAFVFVLYLTEDYFDFVSGNPMMVIGIVFTAGVLLLLGSKLNQWPKRYNPLNIPIHMLPAAN